MCVCGGVGGGSGSSNDPSAGELIPSWNGDDVFTVSEPKKYANQMKLFKPITSGIFSGLTGGLMGARALVAFDVVAPEMTQSQINYRPYSH